MQGGFMVTVGNVPLTPAAQYLLCVRATDVNSVDPRLASTDMEVTVYNSYQPPQFSQAVINIAFNENYAGLITPIQVQALNYLFDALNFRILPGSDTGPFTIGLDTGNITITTAQDYEALLDKSWQVVVEASENATYSATAKVMITVQDVDDNPPYFPYSVYISPSGIIPEDRAVGFSVGIIAAQDGDTLPANKVYNFSLSGTDSSYFSVSRTTDGQANIAIARNLSYDARPRSPYYELILIATKSSGAGSASVRIYVSNANNNPPYFPMNYTISIERAQAAITPFLYLSAIDIDGSGITYFFLVNGQLVSDNAPFRIDQNSGGLSLITAVPSANSYLLSIVARDTGGCTGCTTTTAPLVGPAGSLLIQIVDVSKAKPTVTCSNVFVVEEQKPKGTLVGSVSASVNTDPTQSNRLVYSLISNAFVINPSKFLAIGSSNGSIVLNDVLNRANLPDGKPADFLYFTVQVQVPAIQPVSTLCNFKLNLTDINDNPPIFDPPNLRVILANNQYYNNIVVTQVVATDSDDPTQTTGIVLYRQLPLFSWPTGLALDGSTGRVTVIGTASSSLAGRLVVEAYNSAPLTTGTAWNNMTITVIVSSNANLIPPTVTYQFNSATGFTQSADSLTMIYWANFIATQQLVTVTATLPQSANYSIFLDLFPGNAPITNNLRYAISSQSAQNPPSNSATISLYPGSKAYDYTAINVYYIRVRASRIDIVQGFGEVYWDTVFTVNLVDVNNKAPNFVDSDTLTTIYLPENIPQLPVLQQVLAIDGNLYPPFKLVNYNLTSTTSTFFTLIGSTLQVNGAFNREVQDTYTIKLIATDSSPASNGLPYNSVSLKMTVTITDVNDNPPVFNQTSFSLTVLETTAIGTRLTTVTGTDPDLNPLLTYQLSGSSDFYVNGITGDIYLARNLNYQTTPSYTLSYVVSDGVNTGAAQLVITVIRVDDQNPSFQGSGFSFTADEWSTTVTGSPVAGFPPPGSTGSVMYQLVQGQPWTSKFLLNGNTGQLTLVGSQGLERDAPFGFPQYTLTASVQYLSRFNYANLVVSVNDINNKAPRWPPAARNISLPENTAPNAVFALLSAPDADSGVNNQSSYRLVSGPNVTIDTNGSVRALQTYNYESLNESQRQFTFVVEAKNTAPVYNNASAFYTATATVTVTITDLSDTPITFPNTQVTATVSEASVVGSTVYTVRANYIDDFDNQKLEYSLVGLPNPNFNPTLFEVYNLPTINSAGIRLLSQLDYEGGKTPLSTTLIIQVRTQGLQTATCTVTMSTIVVNNLAPVISSSPPTLPNYTDGITTQKMATITVTDTEPPDTAFNITLDPISSAGGMFELRNVAPTTADLYINGTLVRSRLMADSTVPGPVIWPLVIVANDLRAPRQTSSITLNMVVLPAASIIPTNVTSNNSITANLVNVPITPGRMWAIDPSGQSDPTKMTYMLDPTFPVSSSFNLLTDSQQPGTFFVVATTKLAYDPNRPTYFLPVIVTDSLSRRGTSTLTVTILNDAAVTVGYDVTYTYLSQNQNSMSSMPISLMPVSGGTPVNRSAITFSLIVENKVQYSFSIGQNGVLYMRSATSEGNYTVRATVTDQQGNQATSNMNVTVTYLTPDALQNMLVFRMQNMTSYDFYKRVKDPAGTSATSVLPSYGDKLVTLMANLIPTQPNFIVVIVLNEDTLNKFLDVGVAAHGSPYYNPTKLTGLINANLATFAASMAPSILVNNPLDYCLTELASASSCPGLTGCRTVTKDVGTPQTYLSQGLTTVGPTMATYPLCDCGIVPDQDPLVCDAYTCYNDGYCSVEAGTSTTICNCNTAAGYTGPRCQRTELTFLGSGSYAFGKSLGGCIQLLISFHFITSVSTPALLFYAGPTDQTGPGVLGFRDFLAVEIVNSNQIKLTVELGSGPSNATLTLGNGLTLSDSRWHRVDVVLNNGLVSFMFDSCRNIPLAGFSNPSRSPNSGCLVQMNMTPPSVALNVGSWPSQLGGRYTPTYLPTGATLYPTSVTTNGFTGTLRMARVNGHILTLDQRGTGSGFSNTNSRLTASCQKTNGTPLCGTGVCWGVLDGAAGSGSCTCPPGYRTDSNGDCTVVVQSKEMQATGYLLLSVVNPSQAPWTVTHYTDIQIQFRTRALIGTLIYITGPFSSYYKNSTMEVHIWNSRLSFSVNLGDYRFLTYTVPNTNVSDGAWHHIAVRRSLTGVELVLDFGEVANYFFYLGDPTSIYNNLQMGPQILIGARLDPVPGKPSGVIRPPASNLILACVRDLRINGIWFPLDSTEGSQAGTAAGGTVTFIPANTVAATCPNPTPCPTGWTCPATMVCLPVWRPPGPYYCGCPAKWVLQGSVCIPPPPCFPNPCQNGGRCILDFSVTTNYSCNCLSGFSGTNCELGAGLAGGGIAAIVICLILFIILLILLILWLCRDREQPLLAPDEDIRENIMFYDDGAGEMDTSDYDLSKLRPEYINQLAALEAKPLYDGAPPPGLSSYLNPRMDEIEEDQFGPPQDYTLDYGYEGQGSDIGQLSSIDTGSSTDASQTYDDLSPLGPSFQRIADLYNPK